MINTKLKSFFILSLLVIFCYPAFPQPQVYIPDSAFRAFLQENFPTYMDITGNYLLTDSASKYSGAFNCSARNIDDVTGIQYFVNIDEFHCYTNNLISLPDLSPCTALEILDCQNNQLTNLPDLPANTLLRILYCNANELTSLPDLSANTALEEIVCVSNYLTSLPDLSANTALKILYCNYNELTILPDLSANTELVTLECIVNSLTSIPGLSNNTALENLLCSFNQITCLPDMSVNTAIKRFWCDYNKLDFSDARELRIVDMLPNINEFLYDNQNPFGNEDRIVLNEGNTLTISIAGQDSALNYQWFIDGNEIAGATDTLLEIPDVSVEASGNYTCKSYGTALESPPMITGPGISEFESEPFSVVVIANTALNSLNVFSDIDIYPNPSNGVFTVSFKLRQTVDIELIISNSIGQQIFREMYEQTNGMCTRKINLNGYPDGIYYLQLLCNNGVTTREIIIK